MRSTVVGGRSMPDRRFLTTVDSSFGAVVSDDDYYLFPSRQRSARFITLALVLVLLLAPCSRWPLGRSRIVRASVAGILRALPASSVRSVLPCAGGNWSGRDRGVQFHQKGSGTAPEDQELARR